MEGAALGRVEAVVGGGGGRDCMRAKPEARSIPGCCVWMMVCMGGLGLVAVKSVDAS